MHEHGICQMILHQIEEVFPEVPPGGKLVLQLRASEISGLSAAPLQQGMDHAHEQHQAPPIEVHLRCDGLLGRCTSCATVVEVTEDLRCTVCGGEQVTLCAGDTMLIEEVSVSPPSGETEAEETVD